jgi:hypothetical protein
MSACLVLVYRNLLLNNPPRLTNIVLEKIKIARLIKGALPSKKRSRQTNDALKINMLNRCDSNREIKK